MFPSNAPNDYECPICLGVAHIENDQTLLKTVDIVYTDELVTVFINSFFVGKNSGHAIVVPNKHFETLYEIPDEIGSRIFKISKKVAIAMKTSYECDGITIRQNNEPAADQHAFHYHLHVIPRYANDGFNEAVTTGSRLSGPDERVEYAEKLSAAMQALHN